MFARVKGEERDPLAERRATVVSAREAARRAGEGGGSTVEDVATRYVASLKSRRSERWAGEAERMVKKSIAPKLGDRDIATLTIKDVRTMHEKMADTPVAANRVKAVLSAIINRAIDDGDRPRQSFNPAADVEDYAETARDRYLTRSEWPRVAKALSALRDDLADVPDHDTRPVQLDALIALTLTGARLRAMLPRKWIEMEWDEHVLRVRPIHKRVDRLVLGNGAIAHLRAWHEVRGGESAYVFPGQDRKVGARRTRGAADDRPKKGAVPVASLAPVWTAVKERAKLEGFTLHDWRRTFATVAGDVGVSEHLIGGLLGHAVRGETSKYAKRTLEALREAADATSVEIARRLDLKVSQTPGVLSIRQASGA